MTLGSRSALGARHVKKNGTFKLIGYDTDGNIDPGTTGTGRMTRKGATGTFRQVNFVPKTNPQPGFPENQPFWGTCDTGVISWTAIRVSKSQLSTSSDLSH